MIWGGICLVAMLGLVTWGRVERLRQRGYIPARAGLPEAVARATLLAALQALAAGWDAAVYAAARQWARGYSGKPPWYTTILARVEGRPQIWQDRRLLERSGKHVVIARKVDVEPKRRGRPPQYPRQVIDGKELPGWYARRLTGRPRGRPRKAAVGESLENVNEKE